jgi:hypothetical protein
LKGSVRAWVIRALEDPVARILAKNSHLTKIQLETLLIDLISDNLSDFPLKYDEKVKFRLTKAKISRGSFNRTLQQAKGNVVKAIYTIILLGYLGVFEDTKLDSYIEIANELNRYIEAYRENSNISKDQTERKNMVKMIRDDLEKRLAEFSKM